MNPLAARLAACCGILYPVLLFVGDDVIAGGDRVAPDAGTPEQVLANVAAADTTPFYLGRSLGLVALACLLVFTAYLATRLRAAFGHGSMLPPLALGAGVAAATLQLTAAIPQFALVRHGPAGVAPETAVLILHLGMGFTVAMLPYGVLLLAVGAAGIRGLVVGRTVGWIGVVLGALLIAGFVLVTVGVPVAFLPLPLSWLWFVAAGVSTVRRAATPSPSPYPTPSPAAA